MNTLHNIQERFSAAIMGDCGNCYSAENSDSVFSVEEIIATGKIPGHRRLNIYRNNVNISLREALKAVYPVICKLVGDDFFALMARDYIKIYPSLSGNLHNFGNHFPEFIKQFSPAAALPYLSDAARLEWAYHLVFHAENPSGFNIDKLKQVATKDYDRLFFKLSTASYLMHSVFPVLHIWQANQEHNSATETDEQESGSISLDEGEDHILILRRDFEIEFYSLRPCEFNFLLAIQQNSNFFDACDSATKVNPDCNIGELFHKFILSQAIVDFDLSK